MLLAHRAGVEVFVTGGVGGVHRGGEHTLDVSADLTELGRTPVAVVCAGAKSILDIPRTLEVLETQGAAVVGYGTDEFPAFFRERPGAPRRRGRRARRGGGDRVRANRNLGLGGCVFGVPIPSEHEAAGSAVQAAIDTALEEAEREGVRGRGVDAVSVGTRANAHGGASLEANVALVKNNAAVGARIAVALARMDREGNDRREAR